MGLCSAKNTVFPCFLACTNLGISGLLPPGVVHTMFCKKRTFRFFISKSVKLKRSVFSINKLFCN